MVAGQQEAEATREAEAFLLRERLAEMEAARADSAAEVSAEQRALPAQPNAPAAQQQEEELCGDAQPDAAEGELECMHAAGAKSGELQERVAALEEANARLQAALEEQRRREAGEKPAAAAQQLQAALSPGGRAQLGAPMRVRASRRSRAMHPRWHPILRVDVCMSTAPCQDLEGCSSAWACRRMVPQSMRMQGNVAEKGMRMQEAAHARSMSGGDAGALRAMLAEKGALLAAAEERIGRLEALQTLAKVAPLSPLMHSVPATSQAHALVVSPAVYASTPQHQKYHNVYRCVAQKGNSYGVIET